MQKRAHFIGLAGMGMSATAILLKEQGWKVGGSDAEAYSPATDQLEQHGIPFSKTYDATNIPKDADIIVIGKNAKLTRENPEVAAAYDSGIRVASFPEVLSEVVTNREPIVVAGSYGKSTTTALLAWILSSSGIDAGWFIGAAPEGLEPAHLGTHPVFVIEGDEYPTSHEDPRPKFAHYGARDALITAATHDHVNIYKTHAAYLEAFNTLVSGLSPDGILTLCADEPFARALDVGTKAQTVLYGLSAEATWRAEDIVHGEDTTFELTKNGERIAHIKTSLIGKHNIQNIVGAAALVLERGLVTPTQIAVAIEDFQGIARRLDKKTRLSSVPAHEAFGSSREKLQAAIQAMRSQYPEKRLVVVFEPHTFSWRNKNMLHWFDTAFDGAGLVVLYKPAEQGADTHEQSSQKEMAERLKSAGIIVKTALVPEDVLHILTAEIEENDVVLLSSSGPMDGLIERIPEWLDNTFV